MLLQAILDRLPVPKILLRKKQAASICTLVKVVISGVLIFSKTFQVLAVEQMALTGDNVFSFAFVF